MINQGERVSLLDPVKIKKAAYGDDAQKRPSHNSGAGIYYEPLYKKVFEKRWKVLSKILSEQWLMLENPSVPFWRYND